MKNKAFTMIEVIITIVLLGIIAGIGAEIISKMYANYIQSRTIAYLQSQSDITVEQIAKRLQYRIKDTIAMRHNLQARSCSGRCTTQKFTIIQIKPKNMKKSILFFISISLAATIAAQQNITIKGHIDGLENEALVLRYRYDGANVIDTIYAKNGDIDFVKEVNLTYPVYANLTYIGEKKNLMSRNTSFFIDNGSQITLSGSLDEYYNIQAEGSPY